MGIDSRKIRGGICRGGEKKKREMQTLILAGGLGTRLQKAVRHYPKPMALINDRPFLEYLILHLKKYNLTEIVLCIGYLGEKIKEYFQDGAKWGVKIEYSQEAKPLGTGGPIKLADNFIKNNNFLVLNGDSYLNIDLNELIEFHKLQKALATLALVEINKPDRYGLVEVDKDYHITSFREKGAAAKSNLINGGVYIFHKSIFNFIPEGKISLEKDIFPKLIGKRFYGKPYRTYFIDIGVSEDYNRIQKEFWKLKNAYSF